jgi:hypothetical protein
MINFVMILCEVFQNGKNYEEMRDKGIFIRMFNKVPYQWIPFLNWKPDKYKNKIEEHHQKVNLENNKLYNNLIKETKYFIRQEPLYKVSAKRSFLGKQFNNSNNKLGENHCFGSYQKFISSVLHEIANNNIVNNEFLHIVKVFFLLKYNYDILTMINEEGQLEFYGGFNYPRERINDIPEEYKLCGNFLTANWLSKIGFYFDILIPAQYTRLITNISEDIKQTTGDDKPPFDQIFCILPEFSYGSNSTDYVAYVSKKYKMEIVPHYDYTVSDEDKEKIEKIIKKYEDRLEKIGPVLQDLGFSCVYTKHIEEKVYPFEINDSKIIIYLKIKKQENPEIIKSVTINLQSPHITKYINENIKLKDVINKKNRQEYYMLINYLKQHGLDVDTNENRFYVSDKINDFLENNIKNRSIHQEGIGANFRPVNINLYRILNRLITIKLIPIGQYSFTSENLFSINMEAYIFTLLRIELKWSPLNKKSWKIWDLALDLKNISFDASLSIIPNFPIIFSFHHNGFYYKSFAKNKELLFKEIQKKIWNYQFTKNEELNLNKLKSISADCQFFTLTLPNMKKLISHLTDIKIPGKFSLSANIYRLVNFDNKDNPDIKDIDQHINKKGINYILQYSKNKDFWKKYSWWLNCHFEYGGLNNPRGASQFYKTEVDTRFQLEVGLLKKEKILSLDDLINIRTNTGIGLNLVPLVFILIDPSLYIGKNNNIPDIDQQRRGNLINLIFGMTIQISLGGYRAYCGIFFNINYNTIIYLIEITRYIINYIENFINNQDCKYAQKNNNYSPFQFRRGYLR